MASDRRCVDARGRGGIAPKRKAHYGSHRDLPQPPLHILLAGAQNTRHPRCVLSDQGRADDLGLEAPTRAYREMVERSGGCTTVPQVFVDGEHLGDEEVLQSVAERASYSALKMDSA